MTNEEAIKFAIEYLTKNHYKVVEDTNNHAVQSINLAIQALEKQIAKMADWEGPWNDAKDDAEAYCPKCDYYFKDETSYCPDCGQKILWP